jgi:hypothetical protein
MPGTRTAPDVTGAATRKLVSFRWIDNSGDIRGDSIYFDIAATQAQIEAVLAALVAGSNASLFEVHVASVWVGTAAPANALNAGRSPSLYDNIVLHFKDDTTLASQRLFIPAPIEAYMVATTDTPDVTDLSTLVTAAETALAGAYDVKSARYSERREINTKVNL